MRPKRETTRESGYAYFVSTQTKDRRPFFRHRRWVELMVSTLTHYDGVDYRLHAYVVMPDHLHLLMTPDVSLERCMQLVKGGFSFRAGRELEWTGEIWQASFTDHRIRDNDDWQKHLEYIRQNPVQAKLVEDAVLYEFLGFPSKDFPQGLKPLQLEGLDVRAEARTLPPSETCALTPLEDFPQGLKPLHLGGLDVRAETCALTPPEDSPQGLKPLHLEGLDVRAEARTLPPYEAGSPVAAEAPTLLSSEACILHTPEAPILSPATARLFRRADRALATRTAEAMVFRGSAANIQMEKDSRGAFERRKDSSEN